jgi:hypothetical protein
LHIDYLSQALCMTARRQRKRSGKKDPNVLMLKHNVYLIYKAVKLAAAAPAGCAVPAQVINHVRIAQ